MRGFILGLIVLLATGCKNKIDYYNLPTYRNEQLQMVVEIPAGTNAKFEYNKELKEFIQDKKNGKDRVIQFLPYIGNYGFIPSTYSDPKKGGDGDALDILVLGSSELTGTVLQVIPIGMLKLTDAGELDYKIIALPAQESQRTIQATTFNSFKENYPAALQIVENWFLNYNPDDKTTIEDWGTEKDALKEIEKWRAN